MTKKLITVSPETDVTEAARILLQHRINGMPVVDEHGDLVGIICQSDLVSLQKKIRLPSVFTLLDSFIPVRSTKAIDKEMSKIAATNVGQAMTAKPIAISPETVLEEIATLMVEKNFHTLPVVEEGELVGVVGKRDVLATLMPARQDE
jgi:CBS domain-containing protein